MEVIPYGRWFIKPQPQELQTGGWIGTATAFSPPRSSATQHRVPFPDPPRVFTTREEAWEYAVERTKEWIDDEL